MSTSSSDDNLASFLRRYSPSPNRDPDAGLQAPNHYERKLPRWRFRLRQWLIPIMRWETPYLARMQSACRSPILDSYFALTANLGTHTFYMLFLPVCFWCGYPDVGLALVHMLALGVYLSGLLKDMVCLPRPLSPPLQRITMSGSAALEYGFPSTHTTNAVSVAIFGLHQIYLSQQEEPSTGYNLMRIGCYCYATSITIGRMYCGMHGFLDIVMGAVLGAIIAWARVAYGDMFDLWIVTGGWTRPALVVAILAAAVRFHPEPADNCPCFDDSVAFLGCVMGIEIGTWHRAQMQCAGSPSLEKMYPFSNQDLFKSAIRLHGGIVVIIVWRSVMKPLLLRSLPPVFRFVDHWGVNMPRRYFLQAKEYTKVPPLRKDDNIIPAASDIPSMLSSFRNPRKRRVSVGPQSEADAREYLANREQQRKESRSTASPMRHPDRRAGTTEPGSRLTVPDTPRMDQSLPEEAPVQADKPAANDPLRGISNASLQVNAAESRALDGSASNANISSDSRKDEENNDREMFSALEKPRIRYDVEVITKLITYAGIAWLAVEGNPILFEYVGLGPD